jgi:hypothetical protein
MTIYDFSLKSYFEGFKNIKTLVRYRRSSRGLTKVKVSADLNIPFTTYRRLEDDPNYKNEETLHKTAEFFNIDYNIDSVLVRSIHDAFNDFFNYTYFGNIKNQEKVFNKLMSKYDNCKNNILLVTLNLAKFIYFISNVKFNDKMTEINELIEFLNFFTEIMPLEHQIVYNTYLCSYYAYVNNRSSLEELAYKTIRLSADSDTLKTIVIYQLSIIYFMLKEWQMSLYYAMQIKGKLEYTNNFNRLIYLKYNIAMIFYKLKNYDEAVDYLQNILNYVITEDNYRLEYNSMLLLIYCLIRQQKLDVALIYLEQLYKDNENKGELLMLLSYLYHKNNNQDGYVNCMKSIELKHENNELYDGYYYTAKVIEALNEQEGTEKLKIVYKKAEEYFPSLSYCNFICLIKQECAAILKRTNLEFV